MHEVNVASASADGDGAADEDVVTHFLAGVAAGDTDAVIDTMAADAELVTPLSNRVVVRGRDDLRVFFTAFLPVLSKELQWGARVGGGKTTVALAVARIGGVRVQDAMLIEQDEDGRIRRLTPHIRPWLGLTVSALVLGPKLIRHPGLIRRAMSRR